MLLPLLPETEQVKKLPVPVSLLLLLHAFFYTHFVFLRAKVKSWHLYLRHRLKELHSLHAGDLIARVLGGWWVAAEASEATYVMSPPPDVFPAVCQHKVIKWGK